MKNVTMSKNVAIKDKELLKFIKKAQAVIQTSLQQELASDISTACKFKTSKLSVGGGIHNTIGTVVRNYVDKQYASSETKNVKRKLSKTNNLSQISRLDLPRSFGFSSNVQALSRFHSAPISRTNTVSSVIKSKYDLYAVKSVFNQIDLKSEFKGIKIKSSFTNKNASTIIKNSAFLSFLQNNVSTSSATNKALRFNLHEVKCINKTDEWTSDEISAGGVTTNDKGDITNINEFRVANGFRDDIRKNYTPARILKKFPLNTDNVYPKTFLVILNLAEKDNGGFSDFLSELYESIAVELRIILIGLGALAGAAVSAGTIGTALGALIGIAASYILESLVGWLVGVLKDDLLITEDFALIDIESRDFTFNGSLNSPVVSIDYYGQGDGSHYRAKYNWEIEQ